MGETEHVNFTEALMERMRQFEELEKSEKMPKWIPTAEKLPEEHGLYIVIIKSKRYYDNGWEYDTDVAESFGGYIDNFWDTQVDWDEGEEVHVVYWMPMPDEWKEVYGK